MIRCLSKEVQGKLRSGVAISSLQQCVEELILNSIDAEATCVGVRMDTEAFKVQVIDNGVGMTADDMECLGNRYHTSKCHSAEDLENLRWYGFRGEALASLVSFATLVEISSRARSSVKTHVKLFKEGKGLNVFEAEASRPSVGTTVVICNFFYNMPVRRKRMDPILEGERIRQRVEAISLMHPSLSFTLKNDCTQAMLVQLPKAKSTYHRFVQIHSLARAQNLGEINFTHRQFEVTGYIGREGHYNNSLQFLYVNNRLLLKTQIHKLLNFLLRRLSSLNQKNDSPESSAVRSPKHKRSQELHGVYIINIKCSYSEYDICLEPAKTLIEFKDWDNILLCVEEAVKAFLKRENLMTVDSQDDLEYDLPKMFNTNTEGKEGQNSGTGEQTIGNVSSLDCSFETKLASNPVHRKSKEDCVNEESVIPQSGLAECEGETEQLGQQEVKAKELDDIDSEGSMSREYRDEPLCDLAIRERASDHNVLEEKSSTFNKPREYCQISLVSNSVIVESEKLGASKERNINNTASASNMASVDSITDSDSFKQKLPGYQHTGEHRHTVANNRKISISDPYVHECLQPPDSTQFNKSVYQPQLQAPRCEERTFKSRRKILLDAGHDTPCQILGKDIAPVVPSKIPRFSTCPKVSLSEESGSLEKFRTLFGKSDKLKLSSQETHQENAKLPLTDRLVLNSKKPLVCCGDRQGGTETEETQEHHKGPAATVDYASLKPASVETGGKKSLAAKLCHLKQHGMKDPKLSAESSRMDAFQDSSTNGKYCGTALNPAPVPSCSTKSEMAEKEEGPASGDWLLHYDTSLGKTVYVNKLTGLSRYDDPPMEETQVHCVSDVSNMAVNVVSELGMEYRCYPFQGDLVLPFLPKSRIERVVSLGLDDKEDNNDSSNSLSSLFSKWKNPVFVRPPTVGVDLSSRQADGLAVKIHNILFPYRFSKAMIHSMKVIHQVDKKFLACLISTRDEKAATLSGTEGNLLVLVDQHAAHERVRLENLIADSYEDDPEAPGERRLCSSTILPPLEIGVTEEESRLLRACQPHLRSLGLEVTFSQVADPQIFVGKVPVCFMEKESNELRRGRPSVIKPIVEEYLQEQLELLRSTGRVKGTLPLTVLKVLASLACHGAIKFNDSLSRDECHSLVASLSSCQLPFQCAHGRPSIAPLADILHLDKDQKELQKPNLQKLRRMYKAWQLYGNK